MFQKAKEKIDLSHAILSGKLGDDAYETLVSLLTRANVSYELGETSEAQKILEICK